MLCIYRIYINQFSGFTCSGEREENPLMIMRTYNKYEWKAFVLINPCNMKNSKFKLSTFIYNIHTRLIN